MSKAFDTINIHTLIRKLLQTKIQCTLIKFIANYTNERKAYTIYINHTSSQGHFKTGVPQDGVLLPTLFNIYTADIPPPRSPVQVMTYANDIYTHKHPPDPAESKSNLDLKINNTALPMAAHPQVLGITFDPNLAYSTHIHNISIQAHNPLQMIKHAP